VTFSKPREASEAEAKARTFKRFGQWPTRPDFVFAHIEIDRPVGGAAYGREHIVRGERRRRDQWRTEAPPTSSASRRNA